MPKRHENAWREWIKPGKSVKLFYGIGNLNNETRHILAIVDKNVVVYKWWSKLRARWKYCTERLDAFKYAYEKGYLRKR